MEREVESGMRITFDDTPGWQQARSMTGSADGSGLLQTFQILHFCSFECLSSDISQRDFLWKSRTL